MLDANIPMQVRQIDTSNPLAGLVQTRGAQEQQAYTRGMEQQQLQRQAMLDKQNAQMQKAQLGHMGQQDKLVQAQLARAQFDQMNDKEKENYRRVVGKAVRIKPLMDAGQYDAAQKLAEAFQRDNYDRMAKGEDTHSEDTDFFVDLLKNQKYDEAKMTLDGVIQSNALLGGIDMKSGSGSSGGATGELANRLVKEGSARNTQEAIAIIRGGGVVDPATGEVKNPAKPLTGQEMKMQNETLDQIATANNINNDLGVLRQQIAGGKLDLGPVANLTSRVQNYSGMSSENSRNFATLQSSLEKMRNDSLRLNKGVQTEGDAVRAWNELFQNMNDTDVVEKRLGEIQAINQRAAELKKLEVQNIRTNKGQPDLDYSKYDQPSALGNQGGVIDYQEYFK